MIFLYVFLALVYLLFNLILALAWFTGEKFNWIQCVLILLFGLPFIILILIIGILATLVRKEEE